MEKSPKQPSRAWREAVFNSEPRRCVATQSKSTTRVPVLTQSGWQYAEGGHEATALMLLRHLQRFGAVKRFKAQPFALEEIGGPQKRIPDLLIEIEGTTTDLHVVQVKSARFISADVQDRLDQERDFLEAKGFGYHVWTDRDRLSRTTFQTVRMLDRGFRHRAAADVVASIGAAAKEATTLSPLVQNFGWDDAISAAALGSFHINALEKLHENSPIHLHFPTTVYAHLFARRNAAEGWWERLAG